MHAKLDPIFQRAERNRIKILQLVRQAETGRLFQAPPGKWTVSQILAHLVQAEKVSLGYMKKKTLGIGTAESSGLKEDMKFFMLLLSQRLPFKYKAPAVLGEQPASPPLEQIEKEWNEVREELKAFASTFEHGMIRKLIYRHAVAGRLNIVHAVRFFDEHQLHHFPQIKRLL